MEYVCPCQALEVACTLLLQARMLNTGTAQSLLATHCLDLLYLLRLHLQRGEWHMSPVWVPGL